MNKKKTTPKSSLKQSRTNNNTKSASYDKSACFYCGETPVINHLFEQQNIVVSLCYSHTLEMVREGSQEFLERITRDAGLGGDL